MLSFSTLVVFAIRVGNMPSPSNSTNCRRREPYKNSREKEKKGRWRPTRYVFHRSSRILSPAAPSEAAAAMEDGTSSSRKAGGAADIPKHRGGELLSKAAIKDHGEEKGRVVSQACRGGSGSGGRVVIIHLIEFQSLSSSLLPSLLMPA
jgi:pyruvate/2-oxoglutarate dehydrogenase complex dihydrolipoamide acyltransferase (E2) component